MNSAKVLFLICLMMISSLSQESFAQFQQLPTPKKDRLENNAFSLFRINAVPLSLPFWDDFSSGSIDTTKWIMEGVTHSFTVGNSPPSLGVILLDGVNAQGRPYSNQTTEQGETDVFTSQPIDLSKVSSGESNTVFLSFFWQAGGKAEIPDANDELSLYFLNTEGNWEKVWEISGDQEEKQLVFTYENLQVNPIFHHDAFQFKFQTRGRRSGPFDSWILDYIFLNKGRSANDLFFEDRSLTQVNSSPFEKFSAIPLFELERNQENYFVSTQNEFKNLSNRFRAMEYSFEIRDKESQNIIKKINNNTPFNPVPLAQERRKFTSNTFTDIPLPKEETDWEIVNYLSSGDGFLFKIINGDTLFFDQVDFRKNDTAKTALPIRDYFAYDDGFVDYSAGINQRSGMLALRYEMSEAAFIKGISINFTNFNQVGRGIDLMIWNDLERAPVYKKSILIPDKKHLSDFSFFELDSGIRVNEIFYVGFMQFSNDFIYVGLNKTKDNRGEIFYNVSGVWQQNDLVAGSLMIRPHLSLSGPAESESGRLEMMVYPNPVQDKLYIEGKFENLNIFDSYGRPVNLPIEDFGKGKILNFTGIQKGIYILNATQGGKQKSIRVLVK